MISSSACCSSPSRCTEGMRTWSSSTAAFLDSLWGQLRILVPLCLIRSGRVGLLHLPFDTSEQQTRRQCLQLLLILEKTRICMQVD